MSGGPVTLPDPSSERTPRLNKPTRDNLLLRELSLTHKTGNSLAWRIDTDNARLSDIGACYLKGLE